VEVEVASPKSTPAGPVERAAAAAALGLAPSGADPAGAVEPFLADPDPRVRMAALGALARIGGPGVVAAWKRAIADPDSRVRARACDLAPSVLVPRAEPDSGSRLVAALTDPDPAVVETAAWALGELGPLAISAGAVASLAALSGSHVDPLVREAAVAAVGSLGDPAGLAAILAACADRPAIRRRAVMALSAFEGPEVEAALEAALSDRDWQVRQAAEDLLRPS
jgi:HEAT repeat protein